MQKIFRGLLPALMLAATLALAGCESAEEKAERYYLSGMELLAAGDEERALVEFRNVFKFNGFHKEARMAYADTQLKRGETSDAYSQYLRLIEQYPDTVEVRQILAEIAISRNDWEEADRHGRAAIALTPDAPGIMAIKAALDYRAAVLANDAAARATAAADAKAVLEVLPDNRVARRILVDQLANGPTPADALPEIDKVLALEPDAIEFHALKFQILAKANDIEGTGAQLRVMFEQFPDNQDVRKALIGWYLSQRDIDGAEAFLRELAGADTDATEGHVAVVQLLQAARGVEPAKTELDRLATANAGTANADLYRALRAVMDFEGGAQSEAITTFEDILKTAEASDQTRRIKGMLARLLDATGNRVGARARIEEVLVEDPTNVDALKLRASWLIAEDKPGEAIVDLRAALDQNPRDAGILTLMAQAHERDGSPELAGERLALAVEVSGRAADESLRYARFLIQQDRRAPAEAVLVDAIAVTPANVDLLSQLGALRLANSDWARVQDVIDSLRGLGTPQADTACWWARTGSMTALPIGKTRSRKAWATIMPWH
jgi:cellulose synthase operon protein C